MQFNPGSILSFLAAFQFFFMALYLFTRLKKGNKRNHRLLAFLFLMLGINLTDFTLRASEIILNPPLLHLLDDCLLLLYGPVLYFYTQSMVYHDFNFRGRHSWHLVPYLLATSYVCFQLLLIEPQSQSEITQQLITGFVPRWVMVINLVTFSSILCYLAFSWRSIQTYQTAIKDRFSSIESISLDWLAFMIRSFVVITLVAMVHNVVPVLGEPYLYISVAIMLLAMFYFINIVLIKALNQPTIFLGIGMSEKYAASTLSREELETYKNQLLQLMQRDRPYLTAELKSTDLAAKLMIHPKILSQVINQCFGQNFFDFINIYRCEEVKQILKSDQKVTIIEAMYQSGFNSKSSFNKEFKKLMGYTPSEFKRHHLK